MIFGTRQTLAFRNEQQYLTINSEQLQHSACAKITSHQHLLKSNLEKPKLIT
jgi:hypothetical protein